MLVNTATIIIVCIMMTLLSQRLWNLQSSIHWKEEELDFFHLSSTMKKKKKTTFNLYLGDLELKQQVSPAKKKKGGGGGGGPGRKGP